MQRLADLDVVLLDDLTDALLDNGHLGGLYLAVGGQLGDALGFRIIRLKSLKNGLALAPSLVAALLLPFLHLCDLNVGGGDDDILLKSTSVLFVPAMPAALAFRLLFLFAALRPIFRSALILKIGSVVVRIVVPRADPLMRLRERERQIVVAVISDD